tara:strand:- start:2391 stop:3125 length:735 start_codon:yes stop_codon:yes gene_type:complete
MAATQELSAKEPITSSQAEAGEDSIKLFVGQVPKNMGEEELRQRFEKFGEVVDVTILRDRQLQLHKGCGFVTFADRVEGEKAITELHGNVTLEGASNPIQVKLAESELERQERKLFVGMLAKTSTDDELRTLFEPYGPIEELTVIKHVSGDGKGFGFVKFKNRSSCTKAIAELNGNYQMNGATQKLIVKFADTPRQKEQKKQQQMMKYPNPHMMGRGMAVPMMGFYGMPPGVAGNPYTAGGLCL